MPPQPGPPGGPPLTDLVALRHTAWMAILWASDSACTHPRSWQVTVSRAHADWDAWVRRVGWSALQAALQAALSAFQDSMWERKFAELAAGAAGAACSPGGALAAIRAIPAVNARGRLLQRHALLLLLKRAVPGRVGLCAACSRRMLVAALFASRKALCGVGTACGGIAIG